MHLTELIIYNFQNYITRKFKFTSGLNILFGDTGSGKSALIRALSLLIENKPRRGETKFKNKFSNDSIRIISKTSDNNKIERTKNKYYINNSPKPLKAFGTDIPKPVQELLPFKSINWQRQHSSHFLIFDSGGSVARILNKYTGMEDQELLLNEIKSDISNAKLEMKRLGTNNKENKIIINNLKRITEYKIKAQAIKLIEDKIEDYNEYIKSLFNIISSIEERKKIVEQNKHIKIFKNEIQSIKLIDNQIQDYNKDINSLFNIINKIISIPVYNTNDINNFLKEIKNISNLEKYINLLTKQTNQIQNILLKINELNKTKRETSIKIKITEKKLKDIWDKLGYCPLCKQKIKKDHKC